MFTVKNSIHNVKHILSRHFRLTLLWLSLIHSIILLVSHDSIFDTYICAEAAKTVPKYGFIEGFLPVKVRVTLTHTQLTIQLSERLNKELHNGH